MPKRKRLQTHSPKPKKAPWFTAKDVERVSFSHGQNGKPIRLGGHAFSNVYFGRIRFRNGKRKRVAIKVFKEIITDKRAKKYERLINTLREEGVRLPKIGLIKIPTKRMPSGEWVQVSQLFGSFSRGSKIKNHSRLMIDSAKGRKEAVELLTKVANTGYAPVMDFLEPFKDSSKGVIAMDFDSMVLLGRRNPAGRAAMLIKNLELMAIKTKISIAEFRELVRIAKKTAKTPLKEELNRGLNNALLEFNHQNH